MPGRRRQAMPTPPYPRPAASHYELLELPPGATDAELRQSFRRLSKRYHPDTTSLPAPEAEEAFRRLQQAYGVLSDPASRRRYDAALQSAAALPPPAAAVAPPRSPRPGESPAALGVRRALSGGEWFALLLLGLALLLSLVLGIGVAWARGAALVRSPSWWIDPAASAPQIAPGPAAGVASPTQPLSSADGLPAA